MIKFKNFMLLLTEARVDDIKKKNPEIDSDVIDSYHAADPDKGKKHLEWLVNQHKVGNLYPKDKESINTTLSDFMKHGSKLKKRDIKQYGSIEELQSELHPHISAVVKKEEEKERRRNVVRTGSTKIFQTPNVAVHHVHNAEASCELGRGTKWCTAATKSPNMFYNYNTKGNFYVVQGKDHEGKATKFGIHFEGLSGHDNSEFQNPENVNVGSEYIVKHNPELKNVPEFQFKHPAFTTDENNKKLSDIKHASDYTKRSMILDNTVHPNLRAHLLRFNTGVITRQELKNIVVDKNEHHEVRKHGAQQLLDTDLNEEEARKVITDKTDHHGVRNHLADKFHRHLNESDVDGIMKENNPTTTGLKNTLLLKSDKIKPEHVHNILDNPKSDIVLRANSLIYHPRRVKQSHVDDILNNPDESEELKQIVLRHHQNKITEEHINNLMSGDINELSHGIKSQLIQHEKINSDQLRRFAETPLDGYSANKLLKNTNVDSDVIDTFMRHQNEKNRNEAFQHPNISTETLRFMGNFGSIKDKFAVARHKKTDQDTLHRLAHSNGNDEEMRFALADNVNTREDTLHHLATTELSMPKDDIFMQRFIARNKNAHPDTVHILVKNIARVHKERNDLPEIHHNVHPDTRHFLETGEDNYKPTKYK